MVCVRPCENLIELTYYNRRIIGTRVNSFIKIVYEVCPLMSEQAKRSRRLFRRPSGRTIFIAIIILLPLAIILSYVNIPGSIAFVEHFFTPPKHFTYRGHSDYVDSVSWSPNGKRIASASGDKTVQVWDASSGGHVLTYRHHTSDVLAVAWSPDGKYLASADVGSTVQVWNATTGAEVLTYHGHTDAVFSVAWSPDQTRIASASNDGTVQVWDATSGKTIVTFGSKFVTKGFPLPWNTVAWSPDGKRIAVGGNGDVLVWDALTARNIVTYGYHGGVVHQVAWSPDGKYLAIASDISVLVWDVANVKNVYTYAGHNIDVFSVAWSPDGRRIASASGDGIVEVWDALTGSHVYVYRGHTDYYPGHYTSGSAVNSVAWSPDGKEIASAGSDTTVQVWPAL